MQRRRITIVIALLLAIPVVVVLAGYAWRPCQYVWQQHHYPFGFSHCCDNQLHMALTNYASKHDGAFPVGEATPEASLSLLYRDHLVDADLLRGKSVPESIVREVLDRGELLGPDT